MKISWKSAGLFVLGSVTTALVGALGSVTHGDVVRYHNWIDPAHVASTQLGQYYIIKDDGTVLDPLCELRAVDFDPPLQPQSMPGRSYVNSLGRLTPFVIQLVGTLMPVPQTANAAAGTTSVSHVLTFKGVELETATATSLRRLTTRVLAEEDIARLEKNRGTTAADDARRFQACGLEIKGSLAAGLTVCQIDEVVRDASTGVSIGVGFTARCLARETDERARLRPAIERGSLFSNLKHSLKLIGIEPAT
jgi:hypothetical protein